MRQWKIAFSVATLGAIAAPFVFGSWKYKSERWVPLTPEIKTRLVAEMERTKDCSLFEYNDRVLKGLGLKPAMSDIMSAVRCNQERNELENGGRSEVYFSLPRYLGLNIAACVASFTAIFVSVFLLSSFLRRYWLWLRN